MTPIYQDNIILYFWLISSVVCSFFGFRGIYEAIKQKDKELLTQSILWLGASIGPSAIIIGAFGVIYGLSWLLNEGFPSAIFWILNLKDND